MMTPVGMPTTAQTGVPPATPVHPPCAKGLTADQIRAQGAGGSQLSQFYASLGVPLPAGVSAATVAQALEDIHTTKNTVTKKLHHLHRLASSIAKYDLPRQQQIIQQELEAEIASLLSPYGAVPRPGDLDPVPPLGTPNLQEVQDLLRSLNPSQTCCDRSSLSGFAQLSSYCGMYFPGQHHDDATYKNAVHGPGCGQKTGFNLCVLAQAAQHLTLHEQSEVMVCCAALRAFHCDDDDMKAAAQGQLPPAEGIGTRALVPQVIGAGLSVGKATATSMLLAIAWHHGWTETQTAALMQLANNPTGLSKPELLGCYKAMPFCMAATLNKTAPKAGSVAEQTRFKLDLGESAPPLAPARTLQPII